VGDKKHKRIHWLHWYADKPIKAVNSIFNRVYELCCACGWY